VKIRKVVFMLRLKYKLRFWKTDLVIAVNIFAIAAFFSLVGWLMFGPAGIIGSVFLTMAIVQLLDIP